MAGRKQRATLAPILRLEKAFTRWRESRVPGARIPKSLWARAVKLARKHGVARIATALSLDYYALKKRVECVGDSSGANSEPATFVELPPHAPALGASECTIELQDGNGASMRLQISGADLPDLIDLTHRFWTTD